VSVSVLDTPEGLGGELVGWCRRLAAHKKWGIGCTAHQLSHLGGWVRGRRGVTDFLLSVAFSGQ
jgi:hypothetical protein